MQIAYTEKSLSEVMEIFSKGFKVPPGEKIIESTYFIDVAQNRVIFRHAIQKEGEDKPAPLIVLPNAKN